MAPPDDVTEPGSVDPENEPSSRALVLAGPSKTLTTSYNDSVSISLNCSVMGPPAANVQTQSSLAPYSPVGP